LNYFFEVKVEYTRSGYGFFKDGMEFWNEKGFWTTPMSRWDKSFQTGVRAHYVASVLAALGTVRDLPEKRDNEKESWQSR
jgi:hypothetical protein